MKRCYYANQCSLPKCVPFFTVLVELYAKLKLYLIMPTCSLLVICWHIDWDKIKGSASFSLQNGSLQACQNLCKLLQIVNFVHVDLINKFSWTSASGLINNNKSFKPIFRELIMCKKQQLSMIYDLTYSTEQKTIRYNTSFMNEQVHIIQWMYVRQWTCEMVKGVSKWKCKFATGIIF